MSQYKLSPNGSFKQNNNTAITVSSTQIDSGSVQYIGTSENLNTTEHSNQAGSNNVLGKTEGVAGAQITKVNVSTIQLTSSANGILLSEADIGATLNGYVGELVCLVSRDNPAYSKIYKVLSIDGTDEVTIDGRFVTAGSADVYIITGTIDPNTIENFIMQKNNALLHGIVSGAPLAGASDYGRAKVHKTNALRTRKTATAIRQGKYDFINAEFDANYPTESNDFDGMDTDGSDVPDNEAKSLAGKREVGGALTYGAGGTPISNDYPAKTT